MSSTPTMQADAPSALPRAVERTPKGAPCKPATTGKVGPLHFSSPGLCWSPHLISRLKGFRSGCRTMQTRSDIEIWLVDLEKSAEALEMLEGDARRLAADEYDRINAINDLRERRHRLAAYTALRVVLERIAGPGVRGLPYVRRPGGKPRLDLGGAEFSLSHVDGLALIGVSSALPLGVDLERMRPVKMAARRLAEISAIGAGLSDKPLPRFGHRTHFPPGLGTIGGVCQGAGPRPCANACRCRRARQGKTPVFPCRTGSQGAKGRS